MNMRHSKQSVFITKKGVNQRSDLAVHFIKGLRLDCQYVLAFA